VDGYFAVEDRVRERIEGIEDAIFAGAEGAARDLFRLRKELLRVPRLLMKRLTAVTVIIMVPNFVASIYGMTFAHLIPPSEWQYGFLVVVVAFLGCMVAWGFIHSRLLGWL
jgi:Mg2+ and Co2+ transporter CorA